MRAVDRTELDEIDMGILGDRLEMRARIKGHRIGDLLQYADGTLHLIAHCWLDSVQTAGGGSLYLRPDGVMDFSGQLFHSIPSDPLVRVIPDRVVRCWIFHHDLIGPNNGLEVRVPARVFATPEEAPEVIPTPTFHPTRESYGDRRSAAGEGDPPGDERGSR